jgi:acetyltransferase-like isoleucine patch superfamily enzyme
MLFERVLFSISSLPFRLLEKICLLFPYFSFISETRKTQTPITFKLWWDQKILGYNRYCYWPVNRTSVVVGAQNIFAGIETSPGYMPGCYIQGIGKIYIGDYTQIASQVGIISANHDLYDNRAHIVKDVVLGRYCWIGMGSIILPGVRLGDNTIVAAGSVVTKSFPQGYCVIGGNPAKIIKELDKEKCIKHKSDKEYNGYIPASKFDSFRKKYLTV